MLRKIVILFGTRPEIIKLVPVIRAIEERPNDFCALNVSSSQHTELLHPLLTLFNIRVDYDLGVMKMNQHPNHVCSLVLSKLDAILEKEKPDVVLVQGDTSTALAGALAAFNRKIPVGHVEAGLRSGNNHNPFPEEMNRILITRLAAWHFAATGYNRNTLLAEGVCENCIFVTGNPVVDSLKWILQQSSISQIVDEYNQMFFHHKKIVLTTHRRESFGDVMTGNLSVLRRFVELHEDVALLFPVHLNPVVQKEAHTILAGHDRIRLIEPLTYSDFIRLLSNAWLIISDSGGVQEEAPTLGKPLLVIRENTERPETIDIGIARLIHGGPNHLEKTLTEVYENQTWLDSVKSIPNPFGDGKSGKRIADCLYSIFH
jgi:UDP-N-acetylglucosamine 2-epimerase (non-hydrolysing)